MTKVKDKKGVKKKYSFPKDVLNLKWGKHIRNVDLRYSDQDKLRSNYCDIIIYTTDGMIKKYQDIDVDTAEAAIKRMRKQRIKHDEETQKRKSEAEHERETKKYLKKLESKIGIHLYDEKGYLTLLSSHHKFCIIIKWTDKYGNPSYFAEFLKVDTNKLGIFENGIMLMSFKNKKACIEEYERLTNKYGLRDKNLYNTDYATVYLYIDGKYLEEDGNDD